MTDSAETGSIETPPLDVSWRPDLEALCREHFNEPVIVMGSLCRLIGYREDDDDCCYIVSRTKYDAEKGDRRYWTCVGGLTFLHSLKEQGKVTAWNGELWNDFTRLDADLHSLGSPKVEAFILELCRTPFDPGAVDEDGCVGE